MDQDIQAAETLMDRQTQLVQAIRLADVHGNKRRRLAGGRGGDEAEASVLPHLDLLARRWWFRFGLPCLDRLRSRRPGGGLRGRLRRARRDERRLSPAHHHHPASPHRVEPAQGGGLAVAAGSQGVLIVRDIATSFTDQ